MIAASCMDEEAQKSFFVSSLSHSLCFTGVQGRFLASLEMTIWGKAVFSFRRLPHRGKGEVLAADRVLSLISSLRRFFSLIFIPPVPYPSRFARHLPHAGKAFVRGKRYSRISGFTYFSFADCVFACQ